MVSVGAAVARSRGCASVPAAMMHAARQSHNDRRRDCPTFGGAGLTATKRVFKVDDVGEAPSATGILPSVMVRMSHDTFDLASMNADILQRVIVERCQFGDRRPHAPLGAHPCPEPDNRGRGLCDRTGRSVLHACRLAEILRLPRGACTQPLRLTPMLKSNSAGLRHCESSSGS
jgi:hypothetical protein